MEEKSEKKVLKHRPIEEISFAVTGKKEEKLEKMLEIIQNGVFTFDKLATATKIPKPTLYKYINQLKDKNAIYEEDKKFYAYEKEKEDFNDDRFLDFILPEILYTVKIKRLLTLPQKDDPEEDSNDDRENLKKRSVKTIIIEFTQKGYEQQIAELLYDKFLNEVALITVGIGGLIIYMSKNNKKSKVYSYLTDHMKGED